jgi:two-component system nitrate/nitrite response regulator NarL
MVNAELVTERGESIAVRAFMITDHRLLIDAISSVVGQGEHWSMVGSLTGFELAQQCLKSLLSSPVDVVLIDAMTEVPNAIDITRRVKEELPDARIVIIGLEHSEADILRFVEAGAVGYVLKHASLEDISSTIAAVHSGQSPCSARVAAWLFNRVAELARLHTTRPGPGQVNLTNREKEILALMSVGLSNKEIAGRLNIALYTAKNHVHNILDKFQVHYRREAIGLARKYGFVDRVPPLSLALVQAVALMAGHFLATGLCHLSDNFGV